MLVTTTYINKDENCRIGEEQVESDLTPKEVYHQSRKEFGRCTGKVYVDTATGTVHCGWVFLKKDKYSDCNQCYNREVWVCLSEVVQERQTAPVQAS